MDKPQIIIIKNIDASSNCSPTPLPVKLPKQPRTPEANYKWAELTEIQRQKTATALDECRRLYERLKLEEHDNVYSK